MWGIFAGMCIVLRSEMRSTTPKFALRHTESLAPHFHSFFHFHLRLFIMLLDKMVQSAYYSNIKTVNKEQENTLTLLLLRHNVLFVVYLSLLGGLVWKCKRQPYLFTFEDMTDHLGSGADDLRFLAVLNKTFGCPALVVFIDYPKKTAHSCDFFCGFL